MSYHTQTGPAPCPLTETAEWHAHQARRHRAQLPDDGTEPQLSPAIVWHRGWAEWHEGQLALIADAAAASAEAPAGF